MKHSYAHIPQVQSEATPVPGEDEDEDHTLQDRPLLSDPSSDPSSSFSPYLPANNYSPTSDQTPEKMGFMITLATCVSCLGGFLFGYDTGVIAGILIAPSFQNRFGIDPNNKVEQASVNGTIVALLQVGCLVGALAANWFADKFGRKPTIIGGSCVFIFGGVLQTVGADLNMVYVGRFVAGLGVGVLSMMVPIYIAELSPKTLRGRLGGFWQFFIVTGIAASYWVNYASKRLLPPTSDALWQIPTGLQIPPGLLLVIGMLAMPESPRWLVAHGRPDDAAVVLAKVRGWEVEDVAVEMEVEGIVDGIKEETRRGNGSWWEVVGAGNRWRLVIGCGLQFFQQMSGTNVINYYSPIIFKSIGLSSDEADLLATGVYGLVKMAVTLGGTFFLADPVGRRPLLVWGGVGMGACMLAVAVCVKVQVPGVEGDEVGVAGYLGVAFIYLFSVFFSLSWGPLVWVLCSELFPTRIRARSVSATTAVNWGSNALIGKLAPLLLASLGYGTYIFFGVWGFAMAGFVFLCVPETKGKALEEIEDVFAENETAMEGNESENGTGRKGPRR